MNLHIMVSSRWAGEFGTPTQDQHYTENKSNINGAQILHMVTK